MPILSLDKRNLMMVVVVLWLAAALILLCLMNLYGYHE